MIYLNLPYYRSQSPLSNSRRRIRAWCPLWSRTADGSHGRGASNSEHAPKSGSPATMMRRLILDALSATVQRLLPTRALSNLAFTLTRIRVAAIKNAMIRGFSHLYAIDRSEAACADLSGYRDFNAFFTRALKDGARPLPDDPTVVVSPVDGTISQCAAIDDGRLIQAKGRDYSVLELLGGDAELAACLGRGSFCTIYLAPGDYHRIHAPLDGRLVSWSYIPGRLFSVNPATARAMPRLFARNERLFAHFDTIAGPLVLVMVGALFVGSLETVWAGRVSPPHRRRGGVTRHTPSAPLACARGAELGRFNMGSTVILLAGADRLRWHAGCVAGSPLRMGQPLARVTGAATTPARPSSSSSARSSSVSPDSCVWR